MSQKVQCRCKPKKIKLNGHCRYNIQGNEECDYESAKRNAFDSKSIAKKLRRDIKKKFTCSNNKVMSFVNN